MQFNTVFLMSAGASQALQLLAALSLLILLHEFGHYFFARLFKTRVEKFYLFFDFMFPFPNVLNFALFKKKKGDTEYGLGWFPLGGYVKIAGMIDESMDKDAMAQPPQPWEFRSKKAWQRLFIMLGGIIMNVLTAMVIYAIVFGVWGEEYIPAANVKNGIAPNTVAETIGLQDGDKIISVEGKEIEYYGEVARKIIFDGAKSLEIERNGERMALNIPKGTIGRMSKRQRESFVVPRMPTVVKKVSPKGEAEKMGLKAGDSVLAVNGGEAIFFDQMVDSLQANKSKPITMTVMRAGAPVTLSGMVTEGGTLGFERNIDVSRFFETKVIKYGFGAAIGKGFTYTFEQVGNYWSGLKLLFTSPEIKVSENLGGLISFGQMFEPEFDWQDFLMLTAFVSIILAVMNLLPIPGLDGGYVIFLLFEMISGRKVSDKVLEVANTVGLVLLLGLMLYANGMDIFKLFK